MLVRAFTPCFSACKYQHICIVYDNRSTDVPLIVPMQVFMRILLIMCTHHCTLMCFFYDKLVVHMSIYTFAIACMYSLDAFSCIHSMFSVHTITDICASSTTTERLLFHEMFPLIGYMQVFMRILIIMCTYYCTLYCRYGIYCSWLQESK